MSIWSDKVAEFFKKGRQSKDINHKEFGAQGHSRINRRRQKVNILHGIARDAGGLKGEHPALAARGVVSGPDVAADERR